MSASVQEKLDRLEEKYSSLVDTHKSLLRLMDTREYLSYPMPNSPVNFALEALGKDLLAKVHHTFLTNGILGTWRGNFAAQGTVFETIGNRFRVDEGDLPKLTLSLLSPDDVPLYRLKWTGFKDQGDDAGSAYLAVTRCDPARPDYAYTGECISGSVTMATVEKQYAIRSSAVTVWPHDFDDVLQFAAMMKPDWLEARPTFRTDGRMIGDLSFHDINITVVHDLLKADDGYIGDHTLDALKIMYESTYLKNAKEISKVIKGYDAVVEEKGLTNHAIRHDNDTMCFVEKGGNRFYVGEFAENNVDYHGVIVWNEHNIENEVIATHLQAFKYDETLEALDAIGQGKLQPTISADFLAGTATCAEHARSSDVLELAPAVLRFNWHTLHSGTYESFTLDEFKAALNEKAKEDAFYDAPPAL